MGEIFRLEKPTKTMAFTGERFTSGERGQIEIEHLHRYFLARYFARGKDVLDVASGEGYGAALLAQVARSVIGVDVAEDAVAHAADSYVRENLRFRKGDGCRLPVPDASIDVAVSFETIEHLFDHEGFLVEIRRTLRPGGMAIISTPDQDIYSPPDQPSNPHHVHELTRREFAALVRRHFACAHFLCQRPMLGSAILADEPLPRADLPVIFEQRGESHAECSQGLARATYLLCVASQQDIGPLPDSLFIYSGNIDKIFRAVRDLHAATRQGNETVIRLERQLEALVDRARQERAAVEQALKELQARVAHAEHARAAAQGALDRRNADLLALHRRHSAQLRQLRRPRPLRNLRGLIHERARIHSVTEVLRASPLFDADWYRAHYADVRNGSMDPALHYARFGADEGRDPGPCFSTNFYVLAYPEVLSSGYNPVEHYERFGRAEGRQTVPPTASEATVASPSGRAPLGSIPTELARVVFVSGEPNTPGHAYRVARYADAVRALGAEATVETIAEASANPAAVEAAHLVVIWRAEWSAAIEHIVSAARRAGGRLLFDVDDLMFDPQFARTEVIDGIRSQGLSEREVQDMYGRVQRTLLAADFCSTSTHFLANQVRRWKKPTFVLPNGFDEATWRAARIAVRARRGTESDGLFRIGYAAGSRTHQRDFAVAAPAVTRFLRDRPDCRLVLFRRDSMPCLDLDEFPELARLVAQVEWREFVPVREIPRELARFDINLVPLQAGNPFCEAKSELKFFEAALVSVPSICSPTQAHRAAVRDGATAILADGDEAWHAAINRLSGDRALRERMGRAAYHDVLWAFGPEHRAELMNSVLEQTLHGGRPAARAFELDLARWNRPRPPPPQDAEAEVLWHSDAGRSAELTVIMPLHNGTQFLADALDSVRDQLLPEIDLVVIDDCSSDGSLAMARGWIDRNVDRFNRALLLRNKNKIGRPLTLDAAFAAAETLFVLELDAANKLLPDCAERCLDAIKASGAAFAYPTLRQTDGASQSLGESPGDPARLLGGMALAAPVLVRLAAWAAVGGYGQVPEGWENYDLWCRFAERGLFGHHVAEFLAEHRVDAASPSLAVADLQRGDPELPAVIGARHPWLADHVPVTGK
jgi:SAM-dependent methyltransferase/glycosyltransferase involved in cell wall biosynthesis